MCILSDPLEKIKWNNSNENQWEFYKSNTKSIKKVTVLK